MKYLTAKQQNGPQLEFVVETWKQNKFTKRF